MQPMVFAKAPAEDAVETSGPEGRKRETFNQSPPTGKQYLEGRKDAEERSARSLKGPVEASRDAALPPDSNHRERCAGSEAAPEQPAESGSIRGKNFVHDGSIGPNEPSTLCFEGAPEKPIGATGQSKGMIEGAFDRAQSLIRNQKIARSEMARINNALVQGARSFEEWSKPFRRLRLESRNYGAENGIRIGLISRRKQAFKPGRVGDFVIVDEDHQIARTRQLNQSIAREGYPGARLDGVLELPGKARAEGLDEGFAAAARIILDDGDLNLVTPPGFQLQQGKAAKGCPEAFGATTRRDADTNAAILRAAHVGRGSFLSLLSWPWLSALSSVSLVAFDVAHGGIVSRVRLRIANVLIEMSTHCGAQTPEWKC